MKIVLLEAPSAKEEWADSLEQKYSEKLKHFIGFEVIKCKTASNSRSNSDQKKKEDSLALLKQIRDDDYVILLDENGESKDSIAWSKLIEKQMVGGKKRLVFIVGGAFGVDENVKTRAQKKLSLSPMVLNHLIAKSVVLEQIYRSFCIIKGLPYHNI
jgi:23S rRNA (pseudouridine1915-N3)-methyltransferase